MKSVFLGLFLVVSIQSNALAAGSTFTCQVNYGYSDNRKVKEIHDIFAQIKAFDENEKVTPSAKVSIPNTKTLLSIKVYKRFFKGKFKRNVIELVAYDVQKDRQSEWVGQSMFETDVMPREFTTSVFAVDQDRWFLLMCSRE